MVFGFFPFADTPERLHFNFSNFDQSVFSVILSLDYPIQDVLIFKLFPHDQYIPLDMYMYIRG